MITFLKYISHVALYPVKIVVADFDLDQKYRYGLWGGDQAVPAAIVTGFVQS